MTGDEIISFTSYSPFNQFNFKFIVNSLQAFKQKFFLKNRRLPELYLCDFQNSEAATGGVL